MSPKPYREAVAGIAAQAVVVLHLGYLLYVLLGGFLGLLDVRWLVPHGLSVIWGVLGTVAARACPLTLLEKDLIVLDGGAPYVGTFISYHVAGVYYPAEWQEAVWHLSAVVVLTSYVVVAVHHLGRRADRPALPL